MEYSYYTDLAWTFVEILGHMIGVILVKALVFIISLQIYKFTKNNFFGKRNSAVGEGDLLFDENDEYWTTKEEDVTMRDEDDSLSGIVNNEDDSLSGIVNNEDDSLSGIVNNEDEFIRDIMKAKTMEAFEDHKVRRRMKMEHGRPLEIG